MTRQGEEEEVDHLHLHIYPTLVDTLPHGRACTTTP